MTGRKLAVLPCPGCHNGGCGWRAPAGGKLGSWCRVPLVGVGALWIAAGNFVLAGNCWCRRGSGWCSWQGRRSAISGLGLGKTSCVQCSCCCFCCYCRMLCCSQSTLHEEALHHAVADKPLRSCWPWCNAEVYRGTWCLKTRQICLVAANCAAAGSTPVHHVGCRAAAPVSRFLHRNGLPVFL
ncbi:hypothetical protein COO60DRAFT_1481179 [Scenedesmus sp. NREL 46B-D3]|nr:hypothetical protein COO60DRAFT_1481179 [Scenedesmus sp. NREL 46B-D3]